VEQGLSARRLVTLAGLCLLCFWPAMQGDFLLWDDTHHLTLNPWLVDGDWLYFWKRAYYGFYIPVSYTLWTWLYALTADPRAFHAFNLILHVANCALGFQVVRLLFPRLDERAAFLAVLIFALHPLQVETVAWISGGRDLLAVFFALLALLVLARKPLDSLGAWASLPLFALSLLSKPQLVTLPLALLLFMPKRRAILLAWLGASAAAVAGTVLLQNEFIVTRLNAPEFYLRPVIALDTLGFYLSKAVFPWPLTADYGRTPETVLKSGLYWIPIATLVVFGAMVFYMRRNREALKALAFAVLLLLPVLGLIAFAGQEQSTVYDRYMYLPMLGVGAFLVLIRNRGPFAVARGVLIVAWCVMSYHQSSVWSSNRALAEHMVNVNPASYSGLNNLGTVELEAGHLPKAIAHLKAARDLKPRVAVAISNLAHAYWLTKNLEGIFKEIEPLLADLSFLAENTTEREGLALMYRMVGRAHMTLNNRFEAKNAYCQARKMNPVEPYLAQEVASVLRDLGESCP
jgi:protein O-mannosyl-transferase